MTEPTSDIHMQDDDPASNDQTYLHDFNGLQSTFVYDEYLAIDMNTSSFNQLSEWQNGITPSSSTNLLPLDQFLVPQGQAVESDMLFISPNASQCNYSTWAHGHTSNGAQEPTSTNMSTDNGVHPQANIFSSHQDCLFEDVYRNFPSPSAVVDMPGYDMFPLGTTCYSSALSFLPDSNPLQAKDHAFLRQETYTGDSDLCMTHAGSADYGWSRVQDHTPGLWDQSISFNLPPDTESCFSSPPGTLLTQPTTSASPSSSTQPMVWQIANSAPVQQPLAQRNAPSAKRERGVPNNIDRELMLRGWEQRVSKQAKIPPSSVNIVSFEGEETFRVVRERRTKSEKESMQELALVGGSCARCEHAKKKCEKQTPCTGCVKFWNRVFRELVSQAKRARSVSAVKHSVVEERTKYALIHVYNKINAVRRSASYLPKLLSVLDVLTPNERRFLQSVLVNLTPKTIKDLGCYSYMFKIILGTVAFPSWSLDGFPPGTASPKRCQELRGPYFLKHTTHVSRIISHTLGQSAEVASLYYGPRDLKIKNTDHLSQAFQRSFEMSLLGRVRRKGARNYLSLHSLCSHSSQLTELIKHGAKLIHYCETLVGSYKVSVISPPTRCDTATVVAVPFIVSRDEFSRDEFSRDEFSRDEFSRDEFSRDEFSRDEFTMGRTWDLQAAGWLMCSSLHDETSGTFVAEDKSDTLTAQAVIAHYFTRMNLGTMVKRELERLDMELQFELYRLEANYSNS